MRILAWIIFIILLLAFQGSLLNPLAITGIRPDFVLITVYLIGIFKGEIKGGLAGVALGFVMDTISAGPAYYNIFSKFFIGYLGGVIGRWIQNPGYLLHTGLIFAASLLQALAMFTALSFLGKARFPDDIVYIAFPQAIFDGTLGGVGYLLLTRGRREIASRWT